MNSTHTKHLMAFAEYEHVREEFKLGDCANICNRRSILGVWGEKLQICKLYLSPKREPSTTLPVMHLHMTASDIISSAS